MPRGWLARQDDGVERAAGGQALPSPQDESAARYEPRREALQRAPLLALVEIAEDVVATEQQAKPFIG
jgi:hypothetical protein